MNDYVSPIAEERRKFPGIPFFVFSSDCTRSLLDSIHRVRSLSFCGMADADDAEVFGEEHTDVLLLPRPEDCDGMATTTARVILRRLKNANSPMNWRLASRPHGMVQRRCSRRQARTGPLEPSRWSGDQGSGTLANRPV
jgi:hypothetical protein